MRDMRSYVNNDVRFQPRPQAPTPTVLNGEPVRSEGQLMLLLRRGPFQYQTVSGRPGKMETCSDESDLAVVLALFRQKNKLVVRSLRS